MTAQNEPVDPVLIEHVDKFMGEIVKLKKEDQPVVAYFVESQHGDTVNFIHGKELTAIADFDPHKDRWVSMRLCVEDGFPGIDVGFLAPHDIVNGVAQGQGMVATDQPGDPINYKEGAQFILDFIFEGRLPAFLLH